MSDLGTVLPAFSTQPYIRLIRSLEINNVTTEDLILEDCAEIAKRARLPVKEVRVLSADIIDAVQVNLGFKDAEPGAEPTASLKTSGKDVLQSRGTISTLDDQLDVVLGGGIQVGQVTEIVGESGAGKTQFLLTLLLSVQLPAPRGVSGAALYISTESALPIKRLSQLLRTHHGLESANPKATLDSIISIVTPDLESQDHILNYQVPVAIRQYGVRLLIIDSVAANYRAEFERPGAGGAAGQSNAANMGQRGADLVKLGKLLNGLAWQHNIAIVVANQVADRFSNDMPQNSRSQPFRNNTVTTAMLQSSLPFKQRKYDRETLDHQQRWFTGWGDEPNPTSSASKDLKTPSLGLIWANQIACRIALLKRPVYGPAVISEENESGEAILRRWRRWMKVVFAPHARSAGPGLERAVEFEIRGDGIVCVRDDEMDEGA